MTSKLRKKFSLRKSTPDLSEWGKHDAKIIDALNKNDVHKINTILAKKGVNPTKLDPSGQTVFHRSASDGKGGAVQIFVNHKADVNCRDINDRTPLHCACAKGHVDCLKILLRAGASPLSEDKDRQTPLHHAAAGGHQEAIKLLMRIQDIPINAPDVQGRTPLFMSTINGHTGACEELLQNAAHVDHRDINHRTPLMLAAEKGNSTLADLFVRHGANPILQDKKGHNAMWHAANSGKSNMEAYLRNVPHNPAWDKRGEGSQHGEVRKPRLKQQKSTDSGRGPTINGNHDNSMDICSAMIPLSDDDSSSDEDQGYLVPIDMHPHTSKRTEKPQLIDPTEQHVPRKRPPPDKFDENAYKELEVEFELLDAHHQRTCMDNKHLRTQRDRLEQHLVASMGVNEWEKVRAEIVGSYENQILNLQGQLVNEKKKTSHLDDKIRLLQLQMDRMEPQARLGPTTSEKDLREMSAFGDIQEAHEKEVKALNSQMADMRKAIDNYCGENDVLKSKHNEELATRAKMEHDLHQLEDHINELRVSTTSVPIDVDMEELLKNRVTIDHELKQAQDILERLKMSTPGGPIDGSLFHEVERLRQDNDELRENNTDLQATVNTVQSQIVSFQELANINDKLMRDNNKLKHDLDTVLEDYDVIRNRKPMVINGPDDLMEYNTELAEENDRLKKENGKLLGQLAEIQTDIEKTMSRLPSIEEFVATKQENDRMRSTLARHVDALQNAAVEKEDMKQKIEDMRVMLAAATSGNWKNDECDEHRRIIIALKEMVERLKEQNDILELEKIHNTKLDVIVPVQAVAVASSPAEFPHLKTENQALKEMIERQQQQLQHMHQNDSEKSEAARREIENLAATNKGLETMIANLSGELATKQRKKSEDSSSSSDEDETKEKLESRNQVQVLNAVPVMAATHHRNIEDENKKLRSEIARLENILSQTSLIGDEDISGVKKENVALKEMVTNLRETNEILAQQITHDKDDGSSSSSDEDEHKSRKKSEPSSTELIALREMVQRLKEQNEILEAQARQQQTTISANPNDGEILALREMVRRLKEENDVLQAENAQKPMIRERSGSTTSSTSSKSYKDGNTDLHAENNLLKEKVEQLQEHNRQLELIQRQQEVQPTVVNVVHASPTHSAPGADDRELIALREMVQRLKEQNEILEAQNRKETNANFPPTVVQTSVPSHANSRRSSESSDSGDEKGDTEVIALREMVKRLKEQVEILENENDRPRSVERREAPTSLMGTASQDLTELQKQNVALHEMVERLREQNFILEQQDERPRTSQSIVSHSDKDNSDVIKENIALKEMVQRLKEQNEISDAERDRRPSGDDHVKIQYVPSTAASPAVQHSDDLYRENMALREMVERLKEQTSILDHELQQAPKRESFVPSSPRSRASTSSLSEDSHNVHHENIALREMVGRLKEQIEILEQYKDIGRPQVGDDEVVVQEIVQMQAAPVVHAAPIKSAKEYDSNSSDSESEMHGLNAESERKFNDLQNMIDNLKGENQMLHAKNQQLSGSQQTAHLVDENIALKEMVARLREQSEILGAESPKTSADYEELQRKYQTLLDALSKQKKSGHSSDSSDDEGKLRKKRQKPHKRATMRRSSDSETTDSDIEPKKSSRVATASDNKQIDALKAMVTSQKERIEILESELNRPSRGIRPLDVWSNDDEKIKMRSDIQRLEMKLAEAMKLNQAVKTDSDIDELRNMVASLNERNRELEAQVLQVTAMNTEVGRLMTANEQLNARNKALDVMIKQLSGELTADKSDSDSDSDTESLVKPQQVKLVETVPTMAAPPIDDSDILNLRREKDGLKEMVKSLRENVEILERELDLERERSAKIEVIPVSVDLEKDNMRLRERIATLEGLLDEAKHQKIDVDNSEMKIQNTALLQMVESLKERIENLELELAQKPKDIAVMPEKIQIVEAVPVHAGVDTVRRDSSSSSDSDDNKDNSNAELDALRSIVESQKDNIHMLESELDQKPKEVMVHVKDSRPDEAMQNIISHQKEHIEALEAELDQKPKERIIEVKDDRAVDALNEMVNCQKEKIEELECELDQKPKETIVEIRDTKENDALHQILESQKEKIEDLEVELDQKPKETIIEIKDTKENDALHQIVESQKEKIDGLEHELDQKPKETIIEIKDTKENDALHQILESQKEKIDGLEHELDQKPKETIIEIRDTKQMDALQQIVESQKERIEILEKQIEENPTVIEREIPSQKANQKIAALEEMLESLKDQNAILQKAQDGEEGLAERIKQQGMIEELHAKNKGFEAMIGNLTDELTAQKKSDSDSDSDHQYESIVQPQQVQTVEALPVHSASVVHDGSGSSSESDEEVKAKSRPRRPKHELLNENNALKAMVASQAERIEILEKEKDASDRLQPDQIQNVTQQHSGSSSDSDDESKKKSEPRKKHADITKENDALKAMVASQAERIDILEKEKDHLPKLSILQNENQKLRSDIAHLEEILAKAPLDDKEKLALKEMLDSQREQIEILENEGLNTAKPCSASSSESDDDMKPKKKRADLHKENKALKAMVESQTERIDILEKEKDELSHVKPERVQETQAAPVARRGSGSSSDSDSEGKKLPKKPRADLIKENEALQAMVSSQAERIEILEREKDVLPRLHPEQMHMVEAVPVKAAAPVTHKHSGSSDSDSDDEAKSKSSTRKRRADIIKENDALKAMVASQTERIDILEKEKEELPKLDALESENQRLRSNIAQFEELLSKASMDDKEKQALREMLESQKEQIEILEKEAPEEKSASYPDLTKEHDALKEMVARQKEQIEILESEQKHKRRKSESSDSDSDTEKSKHDADLKEAQAIVQLNKENIALKEIISSLKEQIEAEPGQNTEEPNASIKDLQERNEHLSTVNTELQNQLEGFEEIAHMAEELNGEKNSLSDENKELKEEIFNLRQLAAFADDLKRERDNAIEDRARLQEELDRLKQLMINGDNIEQEKYLWADQQTQLNSEIVGLKGAIVEQTKLLDGSEKYTSSLQDENKDLKTKFDTLNNLLSQKDTELKEKEEKMNETEKALLSAKEELDNKLQNLTSDDQDKEKLMDENETLVEKNFELMAEMEKLRSAAQEVMVPVTEVSMQHSAPPTFASPGPQVDTKQLENENEALKEMIDSLKEKIAILEADKKGKTSRRHSSGSSSGSSSDSDTENKKDAGNDIHRENAALREMLDSVKEENERLKANQREEEPLLQSGTVNEELQLRNEELQDENDQLHQNISRLQKLLDRASDEVEDDTVNKVKIEALQEMVDSLKEANESHDKSDSSDSEDEGGKDIKKENVALKAMIERLREENETLTTQLQQQKANYEVPPPVPSSPIPVEDVAPVFQKRLSSSSSDSQPMSSMDESSLRAENKALKAMVESMKEQIEVLENERKIKESPEMDRLTTENNILKADVDHLEKQLKESQSDDYQKEISDLRAQIEGLQSQKSKRKSKGDSSSESSDDEDNDRLREKNLKLHLESLQRERVDLQENNQILNEQIDELRSNFDKVTRKLQREIEELGEENDRLKGVIDASPHIEEVKQVLTMQEQAGVKEKEIDKLRDNVTDNAFEKVQLVGEVDLLKEKIDQVQKELDGKKEEAAYLKTENSDLRAIITTIQDTSKIPPDQLVSTMKGENQKLQHFISALNDKVDRILSPEGVVVPVARMQNEKLSMENQMLTLQKQMERLVILLDDERKKNKEIISTYRTHLLAAVQDQMDPEVKQALQHIVRLRTAPPSRDTSMHSDGLPGIDAPSTSVA